MQMEIKHQGYLARTH